MFTPKVRITPVLGDVAHFARTREGQTGGMQGDEWVLFGNLDSGIGGKVSPHLIQGREIGRGRRLGKHRHVFRCQFNQPPWLIGAVCPRECVLELITRHFRHSVRVPG